MRVLRTAFLLVLLACSPRGEHRLTSPSGSSVVNLSFSAPTRTYYTYKATLPKGIDLSKEQAPMVLIDGKGKRYSMTTASYSRSDPGNAGFSVTFETDEHADPQQILVGRYRIELKRNVIVDMQAAR
jgi:hypothetical protein